MECASFVLQFQLINEILERRATHFATTAPTTGRQHSLLLGTGMGADDASPRGGVPRC